MEVFIGTDLIVIGQTLRIICFNCCNSEPSLTAFVSFKNVSEGRGTPKTTSTV